MSSEEGGSAPRRWARGGRARTRATLLDAAAEVFAERGYEGAGVDEIARAAGVSVGSIYSHFGSKQNLFMALMDEFLDEDLAVAGGSRPDGLEALFPAMDAQLVATADSRRRALLEAESWAYAVRHRDLHDALAEHDRASRAAATGMIAAERSRHGGGGDLSDEEVATVLIALYRGLIRQRRLDPASVPDDLYGRALALLTGALAVPRSVGEPPIDR